MKLFRNAAALSLGVLLVAPVYARQTNEQNRKETKTELKQAQKADTAQAKADKSERKAVSSKKVKKAARDQDKANAAQPQ